ncbi:hypothetical protein EMIT0180MI3_30347 [Priestia megaterium]
MVLAVDWRARRRLTGRPRKAKPCMEINSGGPSHPYYLICSYLEWIDFIMSHSLFLFDRFKRFLA